MSKLEELRRKHPRFYYRQARWAIIEGKLELDWHFELENGPAFRPRQSLPLPNGFSLDSELEPLVDELVFSIGLVEMLSYWKAAAAAEIVIEAGSLNEDQTDWWHDLLIRGLGEYFYLNQIDFTADDFVRFTVKTNKPVIAKKETTADNIKVKKVLLPLGGGKDSALTLALMNRVKNETKIVEQIVAASISPFLSRKRVAAMAKVQLLEVSRTFDPQLKELPKQGYLDGHTPFSALLAFVNLLLALLWDFDAVVLANEQSANEINTVWLGHEINHQYSKTYRFETMFRHYIEQHLSSISGRRLPQYFSLLRPLHELQIAQLFSREANQYLPAIRSCNKNLKLDSWCGACAKCLFSYLILLPFVGEKDLVKSYGKNMLADETLFELVRELLGEKETKPFECVGAHLEVKIGLYLCRQWYTHQARPLPAVLAKLEPTLSDPTLGRQAALLLSSFSQEHHLPPKLADWLKSMVTGNRLVAK